MLKAPTPTYILLIILGWSIFGCNSFKIQEPATPLNFETDHYFHKNAIEWVYYSGIVETEEGDSFGLMYTIFQLKQPGAKKIYYPSILVIIDLNTSTYYHQIDYGLRNVPFQEGQPSVNTIAAKYTYSDNGHFIINGEFDLFKDPLEVDMELIPTEAPLIHGEDGIIKMGDGNNSGYYSYTNLQPKGSFKIDDKTFIIEKGRMWMDHQWGNWKREGLRWDWFSVRFDDGGALMLFQFRNKKSEITGGNWSYRNAKGEISYGQDYLLTAHRNYRSKDVLSTYPLEWTISIPDLKANLKVMPAIDNQVVKPLKLWEGLCTVEGEIMGKKESANAFVELTGY